ASEAADRLIQVDDSAESRIRRAMVRERQRRFADAREDYREAIQRLKADGNAPQSRRRYSEPRRYRLLLDAEQGLNRLPGRPTNPPHRNPPLPSQGGGIEGGRPRPHARIERTMFASWMSV